MNGNNKKYLIKNIVTPVSNRIDLHKIISTKLKISEVAIRNITVLKKSIDARKKNNIKYNFTCIAEIDYKIKNNNDVLQYSEPEPYLKSVNKIPDKHPFIIGEGPAGLFTALGLVEKGYEPYIFERGKSIAEREKDVEIFWEKSILNTNSNVQFGEGGAGTFSDGKLTARNQDYYTNKVFDYLIKFGADKSIKYDALPHLGTDKIRIIVKNIRNYLIKHNAKFFWNSSLNDITLQNGKITQIKINDEIYEPGIIILAIGNSSRDTFEMLYNKGVCFQSKPFALGFRIEHSQEFINNAIYGKFTKFLGNATYRLTAKIPKRGAYSFCMCPGGFVVASASEEKMQVTNGMSYAKRDNHLANSAIVVTVSQNDFGNNALDGIKFQRVLEKKAFSKSFPYFSPFQTATDFIKQISASKIYKTSYKPGSYPSDFNNIFPKEISNSLKSALIKFNKKISGFLQNGILLGVETRTSSPVRILRDKETFHSLNISNLYPIGEGSGYAGGIVSSAADGYKLSQTFYER